MNDSEIQTAAPKDSVTADPRDVQEALDWAGAVFVGAEVEAGISPIGIEVRRQDYSTLHFGRSCMDTPIKIGREKFKHGLGAHADSEIVVDVPVVPVRSGAVRRSNFAQPSHERTAKGVRECNPGKQLTSPVENPNLEVCQKNICYPY